MVGRVCYSSIKIHSAARAREIVTQSCWQLFLSPIDSACRHHPLAVCAIKDAFRNIHHRNSLDDRIAQVCKAAQLGYYELLQGPALGTHNLGGSFKL